MTDAEEPKTKGSHTLADHVYGLDLEHTHDGYADHDHDFPDEGPLEENPIWIADHVSLMTVGIDTGAVILTGEALRRENAEAIAGIVAEKGGDFVCAAAGHHMESMLAAYGSGAAAVSSAEGKRILNIDIGGGTTKLAVVEHGKVLATAAVHIGGRLQVVDHDGLIVRLDPAGKYHARRAGYAWNRGDVADATDLDKVADGMADALVAALAARPLPYDIAHLYL